MYHIFMTTLQRNRPKTVFFSGNKNGGEGGGGLYWKYAELESLERCARCGEEGARERKKKKKRLPSSSPSHLKAKVCLSVVPESRARQAPPTGSGRAIRRRPPLTFQSLRDRQERQTEVGRAVLTRILHFSSFSFLFLTSEVKLFMMPSVEVGRGGRAPLFTCIIRSRKSSLNWERDCRECRQQEGTDLWTYGTV